MIKTCGICGHIGELTWRDGKYYCAMCGSEIVEIQPMAKPQSVESGYIEKAECPICKNSNNNTFQNGKYHCAMCGTWFELRKAEYQPQWNTYSNSGYSGGAYLQSQHYAELKKAKNKNFGLGILFVFLFWPASIYFFYKYHKAKKEMQSYRSY